MTTKMTQALSRLLMIEQTTNAVTIPAYHRIYDFAVTAILLCSPPTATSGRPSTSMRVGTGHELACVATQIDSLYFLTIQSDRVGKLRFECNGQPLTIVNNEQSDNQSSITFLTLITAL